MGFELSENSKVILNRQLSGVNSGINSYPIAQVYQMTAAYSGALPDNRSLLKIKITPNSASAVGYLDYFNILYQKELKAFNDLLTFYSNDTTAIIEYDLKGFSTSNIQVFDAADYANVKLITNHILISGGECRFQIPETKGDVSKYLAVGNNNYKTPINPVEAANSNLHGIVDGAKFIIITPAQFEEAANRLKSLRENQPKVPLSTEVVDIQKIYNEFSGGLQDVSAIRYFLAYAYNNWKVQPQYVLFFGAGNYDYKNVEGYGDNLIPPYETKLPDVPAYYYDQIYSYSTDDYYARIDGNDSKIDIANGRLTVKSLVDANNIVDKIIHYETGSDKGTWRNLITLIADDGYATQNPNEGSEHTNPSEILANSYIPGSFDLQKIYLAAYPVELTSAGRRKPTVNKAIIDAINAGTVIVNYIGHGSPELWAHEVVFEKNITIPQLVNDQYFFLTAATCDFGYFDIPNFQSAAEALVFKINGGAIGAISSARLVYSANNHALMYAFFNDLLNYRDTLNLSVTLGAAALKLKQSYFEVNDQKYYLFGDPTLRLNIPQYKAEIDTINNQSPAAHNIQIKALSNTRIEGEVKRPDNTNWTDFNGEGILSVFDSQREVTLPQINNYRIKIPGGTLFKGRVSINNGHFATNFVVPKDISYDNKNGKVLLYFYNDNSDGLGFTNNVIIGGTDTTTTDDKSGPQMDIYFDNTNYKDAALVTPSSKLIVKLSDETGINTTGTGVGHKMEGILNGDEANPIDFTNYFTGDLDAGGKSGQIDYPFNYIAPGEYTLQIKAWDVFNNLSSQTINFSVVEGNELVVRDVYNYPNPFTSNTTFTFQQNLNKVFNLKIMVYTVAGRLIRKIEKYSVNERFVKVDWDGKDEDGNQIANGTYLYKIVINTVDGQYNKSVLGKLAVIR